ncbi:hypothetical protein C6X99_00360 [Bacillus pumilus]|nr:hypothetical protein C6X99_00360 [Bacillus pumilus]PRS66300.1 hypothetical protein C6X98_10315 [Bacillus pumilus]RAU03314.1 hypothetical protein DEJ55_12945 [Bacillus pumilus]HBU90871.1 hypothetical protein [Bacillus pumilus]
MLISSFYHFTFSQPVYHPLQNKKRLDEHILIKSFFVLLIEIRLNMLLFSRKRARQINQQPCSFYSIH